MRLYEPINSHKELGTVITHYDHANHILSFLVADDVNSFADECIAKLLLEMSLSELKSRTTFRGLNPIASESVLTALRRRHLTTA